MPVIHKVIEGGEQYLGWALARERVLRSQGGNRATKYDLGDAEVEIRIVGNQSLVMLRDAQQMPRGWVAFPLFVQLEFSAVNAVDAYGGPQGEGERPIPPAPPRGDDPPVYERPGQDDFKAEVLEYEGPSLLAAFEAQLAARLPVFVQLNQGVSEAEARLRLLGMREYYGISSAGDNEAGMPVALYSPADDWRLAVWQSEIDYQQQYAQWNAAAGSLQQAYLEQLSVWTSTVLAEWEAKNLPSIVCPPYFVDLIARQRAGRASQIAALRHEIGQGLAVLPMFNPVMHPDYTPREAPSEPFVLGSKASQLAWRPDGSYEAIPASTSGGNYAPAVQTCGSVDFGVSYTNTYVPRFISNRQAFGYLVNGVVRTTEASAPPMAQATPLDFYGEWLQSPRSTATDPVSFDFFYGGQTGEVFFAMFEYEAYDYETDEWLWIPALELRNTQPLTSCYSICNAYPDHEREAAYTNRPALDRSVRAMRSHAFFKQSRTPAGSWSSPQAIAAAAIEVDLAALIARGVSPDLPDGICVLGGLMDWMLPQHPDPGSAVDAGHMASASIPETVSAVMSPNDFMHWLYAQCLNRFQISFQ